MKNQSQEINHLKDKYNILKSVNTLLQQKLNKQTREMGSQSDFSFQSVLLQMEMAHKKEIVLLESQIEILQKKLASRKPFEEAIEEVRLMYLNRISKPVIVLELEKVMLIQRECEITDLKYKMHLMEQSMRKPTPEYIPRDTSGLLQQIQKCKEEGDVDSLLDEIQAADESWNKLNEEIIGQQLQLEDYLSSTISSISYDLCLI